MSSYFDHIAPAGTGDLVQGVRKNYSIEGYPRDLSNKVYLLRHFESYMLDRLFGDQPYTYEDKALTKGMVFVTRYLRMKHVIVFRLSNDVLQVSQAVRSEDSADLSFLPVQLLRPRQTHLVSRRVDRLGH